MINHKTITAIVLTVLLCGCAKNNVHSDGSQAFALNKGAIVSSKLNPRATFSFPISTSASTIRLMRPRSVTVSRMSYG